LACSAMPSRICRSRQVMIVVATSWLRLDGDDGAATTRYLDAMVAADTPDDLSKIAEFWNLVQPQRLTDVVDVGANPIDREPLPYKAMLAAGLCRVTGFEPQPEAVSELQRDQGPQERYLPYTVGDGGTHTLNICRGSGMTSLFEPNAAVLAVFEVLQLHAQVIDRVGVQARRLDDISEIQHLDFLKIDVQGGNSRCFKAERRSSRRRSSSRPRSLSCPCIRINQPWVTSTWSYAARVPSALLPRDQAVADSAVRGPSPALQSTPRG
jgi:FkbM family methyltransferase